MAFPVIAGNLMFASVGFISIKIVASLGTPAVVALIGSERALILLQGLFLVITGGTMALAAQSWGAGDRAAVNEYVRVSILAIVPIGAFLTVIGVFLAPVIATILGLYGDAAGNAIIFLRITSLFSIPVGICLVLTTALRAVGDARTPLIVLAGANVLNLGLSYVLVKGLGSWPRLGIAGAAIGSGVSYTLAALTLLGAWRSGLLRIGPASLRNRTATAELIKIGVPAGAEQIIFHSALIVMLFMVSRYGEVALGAYGVTLNLIAFSYVIGAGFSIAAATVIGQLAGAGRPAEARRAAWRSMRDCMIGMSAFGLFVYSLSGSIGALLELEPQVIALLRSMLLPFLIAQPLMAIEFALGGALRGLGETVTIMRITLCGLVIRLGIGVLVLAAQLSVTWIMMAILADYALKAMLYTGRIGTAFARRVSCPER